MSFAQQKDALLAPFIAMLPHWLLPNHLSAARLVLALPIVLLITTGRLRAAAILFVVAALTDFVDGSLARMRHLTTTMGAAIDPLSDKVLFASVFFTVGFRWIALPLFLAIAMTELVVFLGGIIVPLSRSGAPSTKGRFSAIVPVNSFGQWKTALYSTALLLLIVAPYGMARSMATALLMIALPLAIASMAVYFKDMKRL